MRRFAVCFSSLGIFAASIVSGCSSDNTTSVDAGTDANTTTMDSSTIDAPAESSVVDSGKEAAACVPVDANVATLPTGNAQWTCYQSACGTQLAACAADCVCNDAFLGALACSAQPGANAVACFTATTRTGSLAVSTAFGCLLMKMATCSGVTEGGAEAGTEGGSEGGGADGGGADGGVEGGADGGAVDGAVDGAAIDAPTAG